MSILRKRNPYLINILLRLFFRLLISVHTELVDIIDNQSSDVEVDRMIVLNEPELPKNEEFFIFATLFEANMIDKSIVDKLLSFELSIGNAGNNIDGVTPTLNTSSEIDERDLGNKFNIHK